MKREEIYKIIDGERDYQDKKWGGEEHDKTHFPTDWLIYMQRCLNKAMTADEEQDEEKLLSELRQVVALGLACFEVYGVPERVNVLPENYV